MTILRVSWVLAASLAASESATTKPAAAEYRVQKTLEVGGPGRWDYVWVDAEARRLYVPRSTRVAVLDADSGKALGEIPDTPGVHGVAIAAKAGLGFTSNGKDGSVTVFEVKSLKPVERITAGRNPDAILFDPSSERVFVFNGGSKDATVFPAAATEGRPRETKTIPLGAKPEFAVADGAGRVYVNLEDTSELAAIDAKTLEVKSRWPLTPGTGPTGLAIDAKTRRLFAACDNRTLVVLDADSGKVVGHVATGEGTDGAAFDPSTGCAFVSNGEGTLTVVHEDSPVAFTVVQNVKTLRGARTIGLDPTTHALFLPATKGPPSDDFVVLVVGR
ncbi:MAG TPA: YncE family protein [Planctomycetota bacterium]|nr:YncE family protein [Planctomycetota bacterium]